MSSHYKTLGDRFGRRRSPRLPRSGGDVEYITQNTLDAIEQFGGKVRFIELTCPISELERRIENPSRAEFKKLRSLESFRKIRQQGKHIYPKLLTSGLTIDTSKISPQEAARQIFDFFSLNT